MKRGDAPFGRWLLVCLLLAPPGCKGRRVVPPKVDADEAAKQALKEYDRNGDGALDAKELERCPALRDAARAIDKDGDGRLSAQEIAGRIRDYQTDQIGLVNVPCRVYLDGQRLVGATVTLVPEKFLGPAVKPASGVSDDRGAVELRTDGAEVPGAACGFYTVEVSMKVGGREAVPRRYNVKSVLGQEVSRDTQALVLRLKR